MQYTKPIILIQNGNWVEIDDDSRGTWNTNSQIKLKTSMLKSSLKFM